VAVLCVPLISIYVEYKLTRQGVLHRAAAAGNVAAVKMHLILGLGTNVNVRELVGAAHSRPVRGESALWKASAAGQLEVVELLLKFGADTGDVLSIAARNGHLDVVRVLVANGAEINPTRGSLPLELASRYGHKEVVVWLIEHGAKVNSPNRKKGTPLSASIAFGHSEIVEILIEHGADPVNDPEALLIAAAANRADLVKRFLELGANPDGSSGPFGGAPLREAVREGNREVVRVLLEYGANPHLPRRSDGLTAFQLAEKGGRRDLVQLFDKSVSVNAKRGGDL